MSKVLNKLIDINALRELKNKLVGTDSAYVQTGAVDQTIAGTKTFSQPIVGSVTGSSGSCTGNAATATTAANGVDSQGAGWIRFKNGVQICWGGVLSGFAFPKPFTAAPMVSLIHQTFANRKILINVGAMDNRNCYYNAYDVDGRAYVDASVLYIAFGYWSI